MVQAVLSKQAIFEECEVSGASLQNVSHVTYKYAILVYALDASMHQWNINKVRISACLNQDILSYQYKIGVRIEKNN